MWVPFILLMKLFAVRLFQWYVFFCRWIKATSKSTYKNIDKEDKAGASNCLVQSTFSHWLCPTARDREWQISLESRHRYTVFHRCTYPYQTVGCRQTDGSIQVSRGNRTSPKGNDTIHEVLQEQSFTILVQRTGATAGIVKRYFYRLFDRSGTFVITFCPIVDRTGWVDVNSPIVPRSHSSSNQSHIQLDSCVKFLMFVLSTYLL